MPVIQRKLASAPPRPAARMAPTPIRQPQVPLLVPQPISDQRGMKVIPAAKYLGTSVSQVRKFIREGILKPYRIANKQYLDRFDLDALIERLKEAA
jgi:hypothetical protein